MKNTVKKWLQKAAIVTLSVAYISTSLMTASAYSTNTINTYYETQNIEISSHSASPETFNPSDGEVTSINYCINIPADIKVGIYKEVGVTGSDKVNILAVTETDLGCYSIYWNGRLGNDNEIGQAGEIAPDGRYFYGITATNSENEDDRVYKAGWVYVDSDTDSDDDEDEDDEDEDSRNLKILDVYVKNRTFDPWDNEKAKIEFEINKDAYITLKIYDDDDDWVRTIKNEKFYKEGEYTLKWDGEDNDGEIVDEGKYTYKLTAENDDESDREKGTLKVDKDSHSSTCSDYSDVYGYYPYCDAIEWAERESIFEGYYDGTFKPYQPISRVEALKVILETLDVETDDIDYYYWGFPDANPYSWYGEYLQTAMELGIVSGYPDGYFRPNQAVNRVEALVMLLNTAQAECDVIVPTNVNGQPYWDTPNNANTKWYLSYVWFARNYSLTDNYYYFYPDSPMTRGEMADMLYRYNHNVIE